MSVILKGSNYQNSGSGISPNEISNPIFVQNSSGIIITWKPPKDVIINNSTISKFDYLVIVRKANSIPQEPKDGDVIYTGNGELCSDTSVSNNVTYYYRFFTYDINKNINNSPNMIFKQIYSKSSSISNLSWDVINEISESGKASSIFKIGDEIQINLSGYGTVDTYAEYQSSYVFSNQIITMQILDFDHFDKADGSGKAGICFGMKHLMKEKYHSGTFTNWVESDEKQKFMNYIYKSLPENLQSVIKLVNTYADTNINYSGGTSTSEGVLSIDRVFIPGFTEIGGLKTDSIHLCEQNQKEFPIFTDNNSRIKKLNNGDGDACEYLLRSVDDNRYRSCTTVWTDGMVDSSSKSEYYCGICFCFNV